MKAYSVLILLLVIVSCTSNEYDQHGVQFTIPEGWEIVGEEPMAGDAHYIILENTDENDGAIIGLSWLPAGTKRETVLDLTKLDNSEADGTLLEYSDVKSDNLNGKEAKSQEYTGTVEGIEVNGKNWSFIEGNRTYSILTYHALDKPNEYQKGISEFLKSLNLAK